jgi:hypothetical protein
VRRKLIVGVAIGAVAAVAVAEACAVYDESLLVGTDGGADARAEGGDGGEVEGGCGGRRWPGRPAQDDPSTGPDISITNALRTLDFGLRDGGLAVAYGYDLDGLCTCAPDPESCLPVARDGAPPPPKHCDFEAGVDNALGGLLGRFSQLPNFFAQDYINGQLAKGVYGAVVRISGYNGKPNDQFVNLEIFSSNGTNGTQMGFPTPPKYDGTDVWTVDPTAVVGGVVPDGGEPKAKSSTSDAYVANGVLVAKLDFPISVGAANNDGTVTIELKDSVVTAKLVPQGSSWRLDEGLITGRWSTAKMLPSLQVLRDPFDISQPLCGANVTYGELKKQICNAQDIGPSSAEDGKNAPCSALSVGFGFTSFPALIGSTHPRADGGFPCGVQWDDSCTR